MKANNMVRPSSDEDTGDLSTCANWKADELDCAHRPGNTMSCDMSFVRRMTIKSCSCTGDLMCPSGHSSQSAVPVVRLPDARNRLSSSAIRRAARDAPASGSGYRHSTSMSSGGVRWHTASTISFPTAGSPPLSSSAMYARFAAARRM